MLHDQFAKRVILERTQWKMTKFHILLSSFYKVRKPLVKANKCTLWCPDIELKAFWHSTN